MGEIENNGKRDRERNEFIDSKHSLVMHQNAVYSLQTGSVESRITGHKKTLFFLPEFLPSPPEKKCVLRKSIQLRSRDACCKTHSTKSERKEKNASVKKQVILAIFLSGNGNEKKNKNL